MMKRYNNVLRLAIALGAVALILWLARSVMAAPPDGPPAQGGAPMYINYQGRLTDISGNPLTGSYNITFTIYDTEAVGTGTAQWSGSYTVTVTSGAFSQLLGPLSASVFDGSDRWLEMQVGSETLSPRQRMASVAYAIQAQQAMTATNALGVRAAISSTQAPVYAENQGSAGSHGVYGSTNYSPTTGSDVAGVRGHASLASGVYGSTDAPTSTITMGTAGVVGDARYVPGVRAQSTMQQGLWAYSANDAGLYATTGSGSSSPAVMGNNNETSSGTGPGVRGESSSNDGVSGTTYGTSGGRAGVRGESATGGTTGSPTAGVWGTGSNAYSMTAGGGDYGVVGVTRGWVEEDAGVYGEATDAITTSYGVYGASAGTGFWSAGVFGTHKVYTGERTAGVWGVTFESDGCSQCPQISGYDFGVLGFSEGQQYGDAGVFGNSYYTNTAGVWGRSERGQGVFGKSSYSVGIRGESKNGNAIEGETSADPSPGPPVVGVLGTSHYTYTVGVVGDGGTYGNGVQGIASASGKTGVTGYGYDPGSGQGFADGVRGESNYTGTAGVAGASTYGYGVYAQSTYTYALYVSGDARVTGTIYAGNVITGDLAEMYYASGALEPGDVAAIDPASYLTLRRADVAYDSSVAGIVSTEPTMILAGVIDRSHGVPLALAGRVPCKVDAGYGPIAVGDLLTTSPTPGHAMKVADKAQAIGAIVGKALQPLDEGTGTIMVLVTLQ